MDFIKNFFRPAQPTVQLTDPSYLEKRKKDFYKNYPKKRVTLQDKEVSMVLGAASITFSSDMNENVKVNPTERQGS